MAVFFMAAIQFGWSREARLTTGSDNWLDNWVFQLFILALFSFFLFFFILEKSQLSEDCKNPQTLTA